MSNLGYFDANTVEPASRPEPVPAGWYNVKIVQSEVKPTKDGAGAYLELGMKIIDGPHANRMLFDRLNLHNANPTAVEIAYRTLSAICHATGVLQVRDSNQLHDIPLQARASVRPARDTFDAQNDVKEYRSIAAGQQARGNGPALAAPSQSAAASGAPPWAANQPPAPTPTGAPPWAASAPAPQPSAPPPAPQPPAPPAGAAPPGGAPPWATATQPAAQPPAPPAPSQPPATPWGTGAQPATPPWARPTT